MLKAGKDESYTMPLLHYCAKASMSRYIVGWQACIFEDTVSDSQAGLLDSRYYYRNNDRKGRCTSEVACRVGEGILRCLTQLENFLQAT